MPSPLDGVRASKLLSRVLRHHPESVGLELEAPGWVSVPQIAAGPGRRGRTGQPGALRRIVETSDKQRFAYEPRSDRIRAHQGHSVPVTLGLLAAVPLAVLFRGTRAEPVGYPP